MRDAALWARIETAVLARAEAFDPGIGWTGAPVAGLWAKSLIRTAAHVSLSGQPTGWMGWAPYKGKPLSLQVKTAIMLELRRFLYLQAVSREQLVPSPYVAAALAQFHDAWVDLVNGLGLGALTCHLTRTSMAQRRALLRTIALRAEEFGADDPEHIWPKSLSQKLQLVGWGALWIGFALIAIGQLGGAESSLWSLPFLALGGFLWATEGPWPLDLPFGRLVVASLGP